jgi:hypothetical protein
MKTDKLLHLLQQKKFMRSGGALPLPKAQTGIPTNQYNRDNPPIYVTDPNDPRINYYAEAGNQYLYKRPAQSNIPLMQKKGMPNINIDKTPIKTKETKGRSNDWYMDTRGEWTNIPLQQYIHGANKFQEGGQDYTSDSAYDLYKQTPPIVEYNPRDTPEFQQLAKQYDIVQGEINKFVPVDNYVKRLKEVTAKAVKDKVSVEKTDFVDKDIRDDPESNFCISGSCYLADQAGDKSFKYYSNDLAQKAAEKKQGRYLEQDEKWITPGDIMQFKRGNSEKGGPYHAYTVLELGEPNTNGSRSIQVAGSPGSGPIKYEQYFLGKDNKVYKDAALSERLYTQLLKRISPNISDSGNLVKERDALKMQMDKIDATYLNPERQGRNVNNRNTEFFFDQDAWNGGNPEKFNYDEPDRDSTYTEGKTPGEQINPKDAKLFDMMGKYSDNGYKTKFMKDHNISGPEYDAIVKNMFGIYGAETKFGTDNWAGGKFPEPRWLTDTFGVGDSVGPFQLGRKNFSKKLKDKYTRKELHDPMIASEATMEFLAENIPLLRKRALDTPDQKTYTQNITQDNYLEFIPYLHNAQSWLRGDKATLSDKKKKDVVTGDHDYKKLVDFYASKFQAIPSSIVGDGPVIEDYRYDSEWVTPSNVDKKQTGGLAKAQKGIPNPLLNIPESQRFIKQAERTVVYPSGYIENRVNPDASRIPLNFMGQPFATGAVEESMSPLDLVAGVRGIAGLTKGALKYAKAIKPKYIGNINIGSHPKSIARAKREIHKGLRDVVLPNSFQGGGPTLDNAKQQAFLPYLNPAMVQAILANASQPVTNTLGKVVSTPTSREQERREKVVANDPSQYSIEDYKRGIQEPGVDNNVLADPIAMAAALTAGGVGLGAYGLSQVPRMFARNVASEATAGMSDIGKGLLKKLSRQRPGSTLSEPIFSPDFYESKRKLDEVRQQYIDAINQKAQPKSLDDITEDLDALNKTIVPRSQATTEDLQSLLERLQNINKDLEKHIPKKLESSKVPDQYMIDAKGLTAKEPTIGPRDFYTPDEITANANQWKEYWDARDKFDELSPENPGSMIMSAFTGDKSRMQSFENLFPDAKLPNWREKFYQPEHLKELRESLPYEDQFRWNDPLAPKGGLKSFQQRISSGEKVPGTVNDYLSRMDNTWHLNDPRGYVSEMRGSAGLSLDDVKNLSDDEVKNIANTIHSKIHKQHENRMMDDIFRTPSATPSLRGFTVGQMNKLGGTTYKVKIKKSK